METTTGASRAGGLAQNDSPFTRQQTPKGQTLVTVARVVLGWVERHALFVAGVAVTAGATLATVPLHVTTDSLLALVDGRYIAEHGIPHRDTMALMTHGGRWIDQQWLSQLAIYGLYRVDGWPLYAIAFTASTVGALGLAIAGSRQLGARAAHVMWTLPVTACLYLAGSFSMRTQCFAYPLFVGTLWLLAAEFRAPSRRRVYLVFPLLILWSNLHGSASMGAGLASLYGLTVLVQDCRAGQWRRRWRRAAAFIVGAPLCLLATPYGLSTASYYRETLANPAFKAVVTEWQPITHVTFLAVPFFLAAFAAVWLLGYGRSKTRLFDALALMAMIAGPILALRNITWFALAVLMLVPPLLSSTVPVRRTVRRHPRLNLALAGAATCFCLVSLVTVAGRPAAWFETGYSARALRTVAAIVHRRPGVQVYAGERLPDWLLWREPSLVGRLAYDSRLELLSPSQLEELAELKSGSTERAAKLLAPYGLLVLETKNPGTGALLEAARGRVILRSDGVIVATRASGPLHLGVGATRPSSVPAPAAHA